MKYTLIIDRAQAIWAIQKQAIKQLKNLQNQGRIKKSLKVKIPASMVNVLLETVLNSPAYAIQGMNVIYFQGQWPEEFIPMVLNHEELHLLVNDILEPNYLDPIEAGLLSKALVDSNQCRKALAEVFDIDNKVLNNWIKEWLAETLLGVRGIRKVLRRVKNAIQGKR